MRISTTTMYVTGEARIADLQSALVKSQQQISTGRRVLSPADDPIAASQVLNLEQAQAMNQQYATNRNNAGNALQFQEGVLDSLDTLVQDVKTLLVGAGNGTLDDAQRGYLAVALDGQIEQMLGLANTRDGSGNYLFSGYQAGVQPYVKTTTGASYNGDAGVRELQVDTSRRVSTSVTGLQLFENVDTGTAASPGPLQGIFTTLRSLSNALKAGTGTAAAQTALAAASDAAGNSLNVVLDRVLSARASVGAQQKEIDALNAAGSERDYEFAQAKSTLQDVDYAKVISLFTQQQTTLEAAQKSFLGVSKLSLFSML